jgi:chemotaxis protein CheD
MRPICSVAGQDRLRAGQGALREAVVQHAYDEHLAENRYYDRHFQSEAAKILPGEYFVSDHGMLLVTVLGPAWPPVSVMSRPAIGGMNHFMLPDDGGRDRWVARRATAPTPWKS